MLGIALTAAILFAAGQRPPSAQAPAPSQFRLVTGAGEGGGPHVQTFDVATATNVAGLPGSFYAYNPLFTGGVRVASCDFNRDGVPDIVTGAGPGGGPHVRVLDGTTGAEMTGLLSSFYAFDPSFTGGVFVACADVTGDGVPEVIAGADMGGQPQVRVFDLTTGAEVPAPIGSFMPYAPAFLGGVRVAACDFNGDGRADIVTGAGPTGGPHVRVIDGATGAQFPGPLGSFYAFDPSFSGGVFVACADMTGDQVPDVIVGAGAGGVPQVRIFDGVTGAEVPPPLGSFLPYSPFFLGGVRVAACDLNGDGRADLVTAAGPSGGPHVQIFDGVTGLNLPGVMGSFYAYNPLFRGGVFVACPATTNSPPRVISTTPSSGATGVPVDSDMVVTFSEPVNIGPGAFVLQCPVGTPITLTTLTASPATTFTLHPATTLPLGAQCTLEIVASQVTDLDTHHPDTMTANVTVPFTASTCAPIVVTSSVTPVPGGNVTLPYGPVTFSQTGGVGTIAWSTTGTLPPGLALSSSTGVLSGTPTQSGTFGFRVTATSPASCSGSLDVSVPIAAGPNQAPSFTAGPTVTVNQNAGATTVVGWATAISPGPPSESGQTVTFIVTANSNPALFSVAPAVSPTGTLTFTAAPSAIGTASITLVLKDNGGTAIGGVDTSAPQTFTIQVTGPPVFTSASSATFVIGAPSTFAVTTSGLPAAALTVASGALPSGVTLTDNGNGTATLAGPAATGTTGAYPVTIAATNALGSTTQNFLLTVNDPSAPIVTSGASATFNVGAPGSFTVTTTALPVATNIGESGLLPAGVTFVNNSDGTATLSGQPGAGTAGVYPLTITASNGGAPANQSFTLTVDPVAGAAATITSGNTTTFTVGAPGTFSIATPGTFTITTTGTPAPSITLSGALPPGVVFTNNGDGTATIIGSPLEGAAGLYSATITASNGVGVPATQGFTLNVANNVTATPLFISAPSTTFTIGVGSTFNVMTAATPSVTSITLTGAVPPGVNFVDNGNGTATLSGMSAPPAGLYPITFTATGPGGTTTQSFTLKVLNPPSITSAANATLTVGTAGPGFTVTTGGVPTPALTQTGAPTGVTFVDNGNGTATLGGTPAAGTGGPHALTFTAINGVGVAATQSFTLNINDAGRFTSANSTTFTVGSNGNFLVTTQAFPSTGTITRTGAALPAGVSFNDLGDGTATLSGTPAAGTGGTYNFTFTFNNGAGPVTQNFTLTVQQPPLFTSANSISFIVGTAAAPFTVTASGVPSPTISHTSGTLPTGVIFTAPTLAGTPAQTGPFPVVFTATNGVVPDATQNFTLTVVCPAITVSPSSLPDGLFNTLYAPVTFSQTGSTGSGFTWSATGLPAGLAIAPATGIVSGTPTNTVLAGAVAITVTDNFGCTGTRNTTINVRPNAVGDTINGAVGNTQVAVGAAALPTPTAVITTVTNVKTNDSGPGTLAVTFPASSTNGGSIAEGTTDGTFLYTPPANFAGASDTFSYTLTDGNGVTNTATVTINFLNRVWYVNNSGANGDGRSNSPFNNLNNAQAPSLVGDIIYVHTGTGTTAGSLTMDASSTLQGAGGAVSLNGGTLVIPAGTPPTLSGTVTLADNTAVKNVNFNSIGAAITASALATTQAILIDGVTVTGGTNALSLTNVTGTNTLTVSNSSFSGTSGATVLVNQGTMPLAIGATITQTGAARAIDIQNRTAGAVTFSGAISATGSSTGVFLNANGPSTFTFSGGVTLNGANSTFTATNPSSSGTLTITGTNTIGATTPPTGPALNVANTTITTGLTFQGISATGGVNGIVLNNTGNTAGLTVTGSGTANSGGTISASTGAGISLTSTRSPSFDRMLIQNTGDSGVQGTGVTNFTFTNGSISGAGNANFESALAFDGVTTGLGNNITGTVTVTGNTFTNPFYAGLDIQSDAGTVSNATVSNNVISNPGFSGVNFVGTNNASTVFSLTKATISGNTITSSGGNGIQVSISASNATGPGAIAGTVTINGNGVPVGDPTNVISISNNAITVDSGGTQAITVANSGGNSGSRTQTNFIIQNNGTAGSRLLGSSIGTTILIGNNGFSDMAGTVDNNFINAQHTANGGGGNGIAGGNGVAGAGNAWTPRLSLAVTNNDMINTDGNGILLVGRGTSGQAYLKIQNNNVAAPIDVGGTPRPGIRVDAGNATSVDDAVFLNISGNTTGGSNGSPGIGIRKQGTIAATNDFAIQGLSPSPAPAATAEDFVSAQNPNSTLGDAAAGFPVKHAYVISGDNFVTTTVVP
jgi:hypothetical protein